MAKNTKSTAVIPSFDDVVVEEPTTETKPERPTTKVWINVGIRRNGRFLQLPLGIPVDNLQPKETKGLTGEMLAIRKAENRLLELVHEFAAALESGEAKPADLVCEMRRIKDKDKSEGNETNDPFDMSSFEL